MNLKQQSKKKKYCVHSTHVKYMNNSKISKQILLKKNTKSKLLLRSASNKKKTLNNNRK